MRQFIAIGTCLVLSAIVSPLVAQDYLDSVVERARKEFNVPGIAVAVIKDKDLRPEVKDSSIKALFAIPSYWNTSGDAFVSASNRLEGAMAES